MNDYFDQKNAKMKWIKLSKKKIKEEEIRTKKKIKKKKKDLKENNK